jgi:hypothetical protein
MQRWSTISTSKFIIFRHDSIAFISEYNVNLFFRALDYPSGDDLSELVPFIHDLPYEQYFKLPPSNRAVESFSKQIKFYQCSL